MSSRQARSEVPHEAYGAVPCLELLPPGGVPHLSPIIKDFLGAGSLPVGNHHHLNGGC